MGTSNKEYLTVINKSLTQSLENQVAALPEGFNKQRFMQNCMTVLQDGKTDYSKCDPKSLVRTLMNGALLGLDFFNGECYAIAYGNQVQFQLDYKGSIKLCKKYSKNPIKDIYAKVVREGDEFIERIEGGRQNIDFNPIPFNNAPIIGAFAVVYYQDGSMLYDTMSKEEIDHTRDVYSKARESKAWKESYGEMCKKTVLRRLCKLIDLNFDSPEQKEAYEEGSPMDVNKPKETSEPPSLKEIISKSQEKEPEDEYIDAEYMEVDTDGLDENELPFK